MCHHVLCMYRYGAGGRANGCEVWRVRSGSSTVHGNQARVMTAWAAATGRPWQAHGTWGKWAAGICAALGGSVRHRAARVPASPFLLGTVGTEST